MARDERGFLPDQPAEASRTAGAHQQSDRHRHFGWSASAEDHSGFAEGAPARLRSEGGRRDESLVRWRERLGSDIVGQSIGHLDLGTPACRFGPDDFFDFHCALTPVIGIGDPKVSEVFIFQPIGKYRSFAANLQSAPVRGAVYPIRRQPRSVLRQKFRQRDRLDPAQQAPTRSQARRAIPIRHRFISQGNAPKAVPSGRSGTGRPSRGQQTQRIGLQEPVAAVVDGPGEPS
jgi:hypothetical protein